MTRGLDGGPLTDARATLGEAWMRLAETAAEPNPFLTPAMLSAAAGRVEPDDWTVVAVPGADGGDLDSLAVLRRARPLPGLGPRMGNGFASRFGPLGTPLARPGFDAGRLIAALGTVADVVRLPYQRLDGPFVAALSAAAAAEGLTLHALDVHARAAFDPAADPAVGFGPGLQGKRRKELGRLLRRLDEAGGHRHETATTTADVEAAFGAFLALEHASWKGREGTSLTAEPGARAFAADLVAAFAANGQARVDVLHVADAPVAALVTLSVADRAVIWKIAHDDAHAARSPGVQLIRLVSESFQAERRFAEVDSLATPDHPMIDRLWAGRIRIGTLVFATRRDANRKADLAVALLIARRRLGAAARGMKARLRRTG